VIEQTRERLVRWEDPQASLAIVAGLSGLDAMRLMVEGKVPPPPIAQLMNIRLVEVEEGRVVFEGEPGEEHYNPIGIVHGGFALTILDSALGCAIHTSLPAGTRYATTDVQVRLVRALTKDTGRVRCEARVQHVGRSIGISEGTLVDGKGKLLATGTTACAIMRA
jgi:uncharacterized protein (TIGR00369 family)